MIHPAKKPQPNGFDLATFAPSLDAEAGEALGEFLSHFEDPMCDECDSGVSESDLMDRLKEALDQRDEARSKVVELEATVESINETLIQTQATCHRYRSALNRIADGEDPDYPGSLMTVRQARNIALEALNP